MYEQLANAETATLEKIYREHRSAVIRRITSEGGGSFGDGAVFFRAAVTEAARQAHLGELPSDIELGNHLEQLALAHFRDWKAEKAEQMHPDEVEPVQDHPEADKIPHIPDPERLRETRAMIYAHRKWTQLDAYCKTEIEGMARQAIALTAVPPNACSEKYLRDLGHTSDLWEGSLPRSVVTALSAPYIRDLRERTEVIEARLAAGQPVEGQVRDARKSRFARYMFFVLATALFSFIAYSWYASRSAKSAYNANFDPPQSLVSDMNARLQALALLEDSIVRPERPALCEQIIADADEQYKKGDYRRAASTLAQLLEVPEAQPCSSDAYYYLGILGLRLEDPEMTLMFFAKIEDLDRFGDDIYWFQALAYVKMAEQSPDERAVAVMALERARSNTDNEERKLKATEMMEKLK